MSDIVERLRSVPKPERANEVGRPLAETAHEAADTITALRAEVERWKQTFFHSSNLEHQAEECECARLYLNDLGIPSSVDGAPLSLVGRIQWAIDASRTALKEKT